MTIHLQIKTDWVGLGMNKKTYLAIVKSSLAKAKSC